MMSLREALAEARRLGLVVRPVNRTGELAVVFAGDVQMRVNARRKDAPHKLVTMLRRQREVRLG